MTTSATDQIHQYWQSLQQGDHIPCRSDVNPMDMKSILPKVFILQRELKHNSLHPETGTHSPAVTFRLAGTDLYKTHMRELSKTPFREIFIQKDRAVIDNELESALDFREPKLLRTAVTSEFETIEGETILLPLMNNGVCDRILGCQSFATDPRSPWWMGNYPITEHALISVETISPGGQSIMGKLHRQLPLHEVPVYQFSRLPGERSTGHPVLIQDGHFTSRCG